MDKHITSKTTIILMHFGQSLFYSESSKFNLFLEFLAKTVPAGTNIQIVDCINGSTPLNEEVLGIADITEDQFVFLLYGVSLPSNWYEELFGLTGDAVGAVVAKKAHHDSTKCNYGPNLFAPSLFVPNVSMISKKAMENAGFLDLDLPPPYTFIEYLNRLIYFKYKIRFAFLEDFTPIELCPLTNSSRGSRLMNPKNINKYIKWLTLKIAYPVWDNLPDHVLLEVPVLAGKYYNSGDIIKALRWIGLLSSNNLFLAQRWWGETFRETPLQLEDFKELTEYLDETHLIARFIEQGKMYLEKKEFKMATQQITSCIEIDPLNPEPYYLLGEIASQQKLAEEAMFFYKKARSLK